MFRYFLFVILFVKTSFLLVAASPSKSKKYNHLGHIKSWAFDMELGSIQHIGSNTDINYNLIPLNFSIRTPAHSVFRVGTDRYLAIRARLNLLSQAVAYGPESYYLGFSLSPSIEYWMLPEKQYFHFAIGGGSGVFDGKPHEGGMGRDYTYNWYIHGGYRKFISDNMAYSIGVYYQHNSNRGATDPNPGIDAVGPLGGLSWHF